MPETTEKKLTPEELVALRDAEIQQAKAVLETAEKEGREVTEEETAEIERHHASAREFQERAQRGFKARDLAEGIQDLETEALAVETPSTLPKKAVTTSRLGLLDDPKRGFRDIGDFASAVYQHQNAPHMDKRLLVALGGGTGMQQGVGADGGFALAPQFRSEIWDGVNNDVDSLLARTMQFPVEGESLTMPANAETSRATGSRWGGIQGYWLAEADQITSSKPKLRQLKLEPHQLAVLTYVTDKLLNNAGALRTYLTRAATEEINFLVGDSIVNGDGVGKPKGLMSSGALVTVSAETSQAAATILHQNLSKMWQRLHLRSRRNAVWLANPDIEPELDNIFIAVQNVAGSENVGGLNPRLITYSQDGTVVNIKGRPVVYTEYNATLGTTGDIILVDLMAYATGVSAGGIDEGMSMHLRFDYNETAFRWIFAADGQTFLNSAITPFKGSNTVTTAVALATRS